MATIGKMKILPIREVWKHEERDFSMWLQHNLQELAEAIGVETLGMLQREKAVGSFQLDLLAEDGEGNLVVIENQLALTNHDHLGKVLTYFVNLGAKIGIWIATETRPEHVRAIAWLNEVTNADISFYLVKIEAYRIDTSAPAPKFTLISGPSEDVKSVGKESGELAGRHNERYQFWKELLQRANEKGILLHSNISPSKKPWITTSAGKPGLSYAYLIWLQESGIELYINTDDKEINKSIFDAFYASRKEVEKQLGTVVNWDRMDHARASRIQIRFEGGGLRTPEKWPAIQEKMVETMEKFSKIFGHYIRSLK